MSDQVDEEKLLDPDTSPKRATPPKGSGVNPRVFIIFGVLFLMVMIFVAVGIIHYRGKNRITVSPVREDIMSQGVTAVEAIKKINHNTTYGSLSTTRLNHTSKKDNPSGKAVLQASPGNLSKKNEMALVVNNEVDDAAKSRIAVINNFSSHQLQNAQMQSSVSGKIPVVNGGFSPDLSIPVRSDENHYADQNMQKEKAAFLQAEKKSAKNHYIEAGLNKPLSSYEAMAGTLIPATLMTGINSDLPGEIIATVSRNIYDTVTGNYLLIPQGTRVMGAYDSQVAYGQQRVLMAWSRLIFPNGESFDLQGMPGVDLAGMSGIHDLVNNHYIKIFGSALMFSVFGSLGQLSQPKQAANSTLTNQQIIYGAVGQQMSQTAAQLVQKNINIQPTLEIRPGANFNILLTRDMVLPKPYLLQQPKNIQ